MIDLAAGGEVHAFSQVLGDAGVVAGGAWISGGHFGGSGYSVGIAWDGGASNTTVKALDNVFFDARSADADAEYFTPGVWGSTRDATRFSIVLVAASDTDAPTRFVVEGKGVTVVSRTAGTSAHLLTERDFDPAVHARVTRPVPVVGGFIVPSGAGGGGTAGGSAAATISDSLFGYFVSAGDAGLLVKEGPEGPALGGGVLTGEPPGDYRFSAPADAGSGPEGVFLFAADVDVAA